MAEKSGDIGGVSKFVEAVKIVEDAPKKVEESKIATEEVEDVPDPDEDDLDDLDGIVLKLPNT
jgi:hypothetical protein